MDATKEKDAPAAEEPSRSDAVGTGEDRASQPPLPIALPPPLAGGPPPLPGAPRKKPPPLPGAVAPLPPPLPNVGVAMTSATPTSAAPAASAPAPAAASGAVSGAPNPARPPSGAPAADRGDSPLSQPVSGRAPNSPLPIPPSIPRPGVPRPTPSAKPMMPTISDVPGDKVASLQVLMQRTRESLAKLEHEFAALHTTASEFAGFRKSVDVLDAQVRVLSQELHATVPSRSDMARLEGRIKGIEARLDALEQSRAAPGPPRSEAAAPAPGPAAATPQSAAGPASAPRPAGGDDLRKIRGIGPGFARALHGIGIDKYAQIAAWTDEDIASVSARIGARPDRIRRDGWIESARALSQRGSSAASPEPAIPQPTGGSEDR